MVELGSYRALGDGEFEVSLFTVGVRVLPSGQHEDMRPSGCHHAPGRFEGGASRHIVVVRRQKRRQVQPHEFRGERCQVSSGRIVHLACSAEVSFFKVKQRHRRVNQPLIKRPLRSQGVSP